MKILIIGGAAAAVGLYLALHRSGSSAVQAGKKNAGIGGAASIKSGVAAFPVGTVATSLASIGSSIFGGSGTHSPVDSSVKPGSTMGPMIVSGSKNDPTMSSTSSTSANVPTSSEIVTTLDEGNGTSGMVVGIDQSPTVSYDDYGG